MNRFITALALLIALLAGSRAGADVFGDSNDRYAGMQISIPLDVEHGKLSLQKAEYSVLLVDQRGGIREGLAFTHAAGGAQRLAYLRPSLDFEIGRSRVSDYTLNLWQLDENSGLDSDFDAVEAVFYLAVGVALFVELVDFVADDLLDCLDEDSCDDTDDNDKLVEAE